MSSAFLNDLFYFLNVLFKSVFLDSVFFSSSKCLSESVFLKNVIGCFAKLVFDQKELLNPLWKYIGVTLTGVLHRSLKNNVSINLNINVDDKFSFQR